MQNSKPVSAFLFKEEWKVLTESATDDQGYSIEKFNDPLELSGRISVQPATLVISAINDKEDVIKLVTLVKTSKLAKDKALKYVVVNFSAHNDFDPIFAKLGIIDVIEPNINQKSLKFKLDFWMKTLGAQVKQTSDKTTVGTKAKLSAAEAKNDEGQNLIWVPSLSIKDDIWITKDASDCKFLLSKWIVKAMGPNGNIAQWNQVKLRNDLWRFDINPDQKKSFLQGEDTWYFRGDVKPDFVEKENLWLFTGNSFELYFMHEGKNHVRMKVKNKELQISENSDFAISKEKLILVA